ncbi:helicase with zinc finger domain 2 isoform X1 [Sarcophilus harrisii]|uniref:helicase with zinc finger domain 2 isoform X1 n=1 Tax=Sarcophilus harrisii TaxID=9305 RepID=UPI00062B3B24|nr:helicase with zinc finger domain 2 isoform X1 [Sarcophilus harrisii]
MPSLKKGLLARLQSQLDQLQSQLDLRVGCSVCSEPLNESTYKWHTIEHNCPREILLARAKGAPEHKEWRKVGRRPSFPRPRRYEVCRYYKPGMGCRKHRNQCTFARSLEEALVWTFERENNIPRLWLKAKVQGSLYQGTPRILTAAEEIGAEFGGYFQELCKPCFRNCPAQVTLRGPNLPCPQHGPSPLLIVHISEGFRKKQLVEIRPRPRQGHLLEYCMYVSRGHPCRHGAVRCQYAHSDVEMAVWEAESMGCLTRSDLLVLPASLESGAGSGTSGEVGGRNGSPSAPPQIQLYCRVCLVTCSSQESFENHCSSLEHTQMLSYDHGALWEYRAPPIGLRKFKLCSRLDICEYGNGCTQAHSQEELQEWIMRAQAAQMREESARQDGLLSYQDRLLHEYQHCHNEIQVMSESIRDVTIHCDQPLKCQVEDKKSQCIWKFIIHSKDPLQHVALLKHQMGAIFSLVCPGLPQRQLYAQGSRFHVQDTAMTFQVEVLVECITFGSYEQWVAFDFGRRPVLVQKLYVQVGQKETLGPPPCIQDHNCLLELIRWHSGNRCVVPNVGRTAEQVNLLAKYKVSPQELENYRSKASDQVSITPVNYRERMHQFLYMEEEAQQELVAKLNLQVEVTLTSKMQTLAMGMKFAPSGELYAKVPIPCSLTPDTDQGYLLSRAVSTAYVAPVPAPDNHVYEVRVEVKATSEQNVWLLLPAHCCSALGLKDEDTQLMEIQFQIDKTIFGIWHQAIDALQDDRLVAPDVPACSLPSLRPPPQELRGNPKQKEAISFITGTTSGQSRVPPLLIYGPFGTGKTYTLAMATLEVIKQPNTKVLICTHTNSAADIYIREYFHAYVTAGHPEAVPLRVKNTESFLNQTDPTTLQYCCLSSDGRSFCFPTQEKLKQHRIIITTTTLSRSLCVPSGFFSHILIDEAAQMLECEAIIPLAYATQKTRIVLAGDHMQITPKLFSVGARKSADHTLLNRLFQYYQKETHKLASQSRVIFHENYRSTKAIISFVSRNFYVAKGNPIQASGQIPAHPCKYPLMFCHVAGTPERDITMTSWFNRAEIVEVIEKVQEFYRIWAYQWNSPDLKQICVVSHGSQVKILRQELRKKQLGEVAVENFENLPGREFRVIILSTVHTRDSLLNSSVPHLEFFSEARVLNTVMTRAQSQVVAVGDAVALCSFGRCSKVWKHFIQECIEMRSVSPVDLTMEQIKQDVAHRQRWARQNGLHPMNSPREHSLEEEDNDNDIPSWVSDAELNADDPILQELLDESKNVAVTVSEDGLLNVTSGSRSRYQGQQYLSFPVPVLQKYLRMQPKIYRKCELIKEAFEKASAFTIDDSPPLIIQIRGRTNCGMAFTGDQVLVEILTPELEEQGYSWRPMGRVVGILERGDRELIFICKMDEFDPRVMIPIDPSVTKIFVPELKDKPNTIPIRRLQRGHIKLISYEKITEETKRNQLFRVQIISWKERFYYPLGIILEILPLPLTLEQGLKILDMEYSLNANGRYPTPVIKEVNQHNCSKLNLHRGQWKDCRDYLTFTVDPQGSRDLDDAISVRDLGSHYEIAVHISDVASFMPKDGALDREARKRGATYYAPGKDPVAMLPSRLSQDLFSLLPQQERRTISLILTVEKESDRVVQWHITPSMICSDLQLTYEEAEVIIKSHPGGGAWLPLRLGTVEGCVVAAYHFSQVLRRSRLQGDCYYDQPDEDSPLGSRSSHQMVEELMILFNSYVAEFLVHQDNTKLITPLRCQAEPNPQQVAQLKDKYSHLLPLSLHLSYRLCGQTTSTFQGTSSGYNLCILRPLWDHLCQAADSKDYNKMVDLIATDDIHPTLAPAGLEFRKLLSRSYFSRSNSTSLSRAGHYSLQVDWYTWASSPIRRYIDVVLQRQLHAAMTKGHPGYSPEDIDLLCHDFNRKNGRAQAYERKAHCLHLATQLKTQLLTKLCFVVNVESANRFFKVIFPMNRDTLPDPHLVNYRALQLVEQPTFIPEHQKMKLVWKRRIYSLDKGKAWMPSSKTLVDTHVMPVSSVIWQDLLVAIQSQNFQKAAALLLRCRGTVQTSHHRSLGQVSRSKCSHYVEVIVELSTGDALQMQLTTDVQRGFLVPSIQMWMLTPGFAICLEHAEKPIDCFSRYASQTTKDVYSEAQEYSRVWEPLCAMESASSAVAENDSILLHGVPITWDQERNDQGQMQGSFCLTYSFLKECAIDINFNFCYLCIRLENLKLQGPVEGEEEREKGKEAALCQGFRKLSLGHTAANPSVVNTLDSCLNVDPDTYTWVAHGLTDEMDQDSKKVDRREERQRIHFFLHHVAMESIPVEVTRKEACFTIEMIPKLLPDIRKEEAIWKLKYASPLVTSIALGQPIKEVSCVAMKSSILKRQTFDIPRGKFKLNKSQNSAVLEALQKPFTLIQGPPGTGKTMVGVHIVYWFHKLNQEKPETAPLPLRGEKKDKGEKCILYCGPSNKSVDVVSEILLQWKEELRPLQVYSEQMEAMEFPVPGSYRNMFRKNLREGKTKPELRQIILHHRIRMPSNPYARKIMEFDTRVKMGDQFSEEEIELYKSITTTARKYELSNHDIILCTCSCSASSILTKQLNVKQILIDEAGMSTEPESLIPLVNFPRAEKVVLLGDHKQLQPFVKNDHCQNLGLEKSLFERYHRQAWMLDTQYRMHKDICKFPSKEFYDNKLKTSMELRRTPSVFSHQDQESCPIIFGYVQGEEKSLVVSTDEGNENSKANQDEVEQVIRIAKQLTLDRTIKPKDIAILSPYNAQVSEINKRLLKEGITGVTVSSIKKSQGSEWRYVILSTVRSCPLSEIDGKPTKSWLKKHLGFVSDPHQVNVGITRAQEGLCIIGNHYLLSCCPMWHRLIDFYTKKGCCVMASSVQVRQRPAIYH